MRPPGKVNQGWTAVIVHGYMDDIAASDWMVTTKDALLDNISERVYRTVILVDWKGSHGLNYLQAIANARLVGAQIAYFIRKIKVSCKRE